MYDFYQETIPSSNTYIPIADRRPSCQYRLARYVSRWAARKLFAGRHVPKIKAKDTKTEKQIEKLLSGTRLWPTMFEAAYRGSVGSVAVTFRVEGKRVGFKVWRAVWCSPSFDDFGELVNLRVHYTTTGAQFASLGMQTSDPGKSYWFIRDYGVESEVTYAPVPEEDWNPVNGFRFEDGALTPVKVIEHKLGFVPGVWIMNPGGCMHPDGSALWEDAVPNMIEVDYLLSQAARGARYNCAPQLAITGETRMPEGSNGGMNPTTVIYLNPQHKDQTSGEMVGGGDAKLLEMTGSGTEAALKIVEILKKTALEQIGVVQKDPGEMPGPLSGRAMEYLDEDAHDTAMQWRNTYGEGGVLPLLAKVLRVLKPNIDVTKLWLQWPRIYQPTPGDLQSIVQALAMATTPVVVPGAPVNEDGSSPALAPLLDRQIASAWLRANMDLGILDDTAGDAPSGPSGSEPAPVQSDAATGSMFGPYWRVLPPIAVR